MSSSTMEGSDLPNDEENSLIQDQNFFSMRFGVAIPFSEAEILVQGCHMW